MSEETQLPEFPEYTGFELLDIISNQLEVIATLEIGRASCRERVLLAV
jgi:hypothetical protein